MVQKDIMVLPSSIRTQLPEIVEGKSTSRERNWALNIFPFSLAENQMIATDVASSWNLRQSVDKMSKEVFNRTTLNDD